MSFNHGFELRGRQPVAAHQVWHVSLTPRETHRRGFRDVGTGDHDRVAIDQRIRSNKPAVFHGDLKTGQGFSIAGNQAAAQIAEDDMEFAILGGN